MELCVVTLQQHVQHGQSGSHQETQRARVALRQKAAGCHHAQVGIPGQAWGGGGGGIESGWGVEVKWGGGGESKVGGEWK